MSDMDLRLPLYQWKWIPKSTPNNTHSPASTFFHLNNSGWTCLARKV